MARIVSNTTPTLTAPVWAGDYFDREHVLPGGAKLDGSQFFAYDSVLVTTTAIAAQAATTVAVTALSGPIPVGTTLYFGGAKVAQLTAAAVTGAVALTVAALPTALAAADTARFAGSMVKHVVSGTVIGRTLAERDAGIGFGPAVDTDDVIYLLVFDVVDASVQTDADLYRAGSVVKENFVPGFAALSTVIKTALRTKYSCTRGAA